MLSHGKCRVRIANYDQRAVFLIIANVEAHVWFDGEAKNLWSKYNLLSARL